MDGKDKMDPTLEEVKEDSIPHRKHNGSCKTEAPGPPFLSIRKNTVP